MLKSFGVRYTGCLRSLDLRSEPANTVVLFGYLGAAPLGNRHCTLELFLVLVGV